jgi:hypothetical protein
MSDFDNDLQSISSEAGVRDETPELSDAEERYFQNGGNVSDTDREQLSREHGLSQPQPQEERQVEMRPHVREYVERLINHSNDQTLHAERLDERNRMLIDALSPEQQQQQDHAWSRPQERPDPNYDIYATMDHDDRRIARLEQMVVDNQRQQEHVRNEQATIAYYKESMDRRSGVDPEFRQGYQLWLATRYAELMAREYPDATRDNIYAAIRYGQIPQDLVRKVQLEERELIRSAIERRQDPADAIEAMMVGRGYERAGARAARVEQRRQEEARQRAAVRKAEQAEEDWFQRVARRIASSPGLSYEDALNDVLPHRADRVRYREIRARRQERSWPGSTSAVHRGAW